LSSFSRIAVSVLADQQPDFVPHELFVLITAKRLLQRKRHRFTGKGTYPFLDSNRLFLPVYRGDPPLFISPFEIVTAKDPRWSLSPNDML
jgi:hypothetical protein